tara:strand:+ start:915 stop:2876 length:1962 start_codon:yes stop_codon:yes gene_type:complete
MVSENITEQELTIEFIANQPTFEVAHYIPIDLNADGQITTTQQKVDREGNVYFGSGRQGVDWVFSDVPEGYYNLFYRKILAEDSEGTALVWDSGLQGFTANNRIAIAKDARENGDSFNVIWSQLYTNDDVESWIEAGEITVRELWVREWDAYKSGTIVETGEIGNPFSEEAAKQRKEQEISVPIIEEEIIEEPVEEQGLTEEEIIEQERQEILAQETDWNVVQESIFDVPVQPKDEVFELTGIHRTYTVKLPRSIGKVWSQEGGGQIIYEIQKRVYIQNRNSSVRGTIRMRAVPQFKVIVKLTGNLSGSFTLQSRTPEGDRIAGNTPNFTEDDAQRIFDEAVSITQESFAEEYIPPEIMTEVETTYDWKFVDVDVTIQELFTSANGGGVFSELSSSFQTYPDSIRFLNQGKTMEIVDEDLPEFSLEGISANPSGTASFTVQQGVKIDVEIETSSVLTWVNLADELKPEGVRRSGQKFNLTMYGGDRLEIDTDNEYENRRPFLVQTNGKDWFVEEEPDDETRITITNIQVLEATEFETEFTEVNGQRYQESENVVAFYTVQTAPQPALDAIDNDEMLKTLRPVNYQDLPMPKVEKSFINPPEFDLPDVENPFDFGAFFGKYKWYFIGGFVILGGFILAAVYVNARGRTMVSEAI